MAHATTGEPEGVAVGGPPFCATYRLQLQAEFDLRAAAAQADYLARLGITHLYLSPVLAAAPGSTHGYDVVDHGRVADTLGGTDGWAEMRDTAHRVGLGTVVDVVPNHMGASLPTNRWWWDVLGHGRTSRFASYFDVDWEPNERKLHGLVLRPVLADHVGRVIERGELRLLRESGEVVVRYGDLIHPTSLPSLAPLLARASRLDNSSEGFELAQALQTPVGDGRRERQSLIELCQNDPGLAAAVDAELEAVQTNPDDLDAFLSQQHYRLAWWRTANEELNYRRFMDVTELIALRAEDPDVFAASHELILAWVESGDVNGLRIDHPDGLWDPAGYFDHLHEAAPAVRIFAEKILADTEALPRAWPIAGTTGYDFLNQVGRLFIDPEGEQAFSRIYGSFAGQRQPVADVVHHARHEILASSLFADLRRLVEALVAAARRHRRVRDFTRRQIAEAATEIVVAMPVYRTYVRPGADGPSTADEATIAAAIAGAIEHRPDIDPELMDFLRAVLVLRTGDEEAAMRAQQLCAALAAKAVEDTALYRYLRLVSLNEVGGDPSRFGTTVAQFHEWCQFRQQHWPEAMSATGTHDMKRGEDHRLRVSVLSEIPGAWQAAIARWRDLTARHRVAEWPDPNTEYLIYQTLVGSHPLSIQRAQQYVQKAMREAKQHTSWLEPSPAYEAAVQKFVAGILGDQRFLNDLEEFLTPIVPAARVSSLAQTLLKIICPGVPDFYQGTELWDESLVDPDNRRPVNFKLRRALLDLVGSTAPGDLARREDAGSSKLLVVQRALAVRRSHADSFGASARYCPLAAEGVKADHLVAFQRGDAIIGLAPRLVIGLGTSWEETTVTVPAGRWRNAITGTTCDLTGSPVPVSDLLSEFPVGLLVRDAV